MDVVDVEGVGGSVTVIITSSHPLQQPITQVLPTPQFIRKTPHCSEDLDDAAKDDCLCIR